jgi:hypothetical protein
MLGFLTVEGKAIPIEPFPASDLYDPSELRMPTLIRSMQWPSLPPWGRRAPLLGSPTAGGGIDLEQPLVSPSPDIKGLGRAWYRAMDAATARWLEQPAGSPRP